MGAAKGICFRLPSSQSRLFEPVLYNCEALLETLLSISVVNYQVTCLEVTTKGSRIYAKLETFGLLFAIAVCTKFNY